MDDLLWLTREKKQSLLNEKCSSPRCQYGLYAFCNGACNGGTDRTSPPSPDPLGISLTKIKCPFPFSMHWRKLPDNTATSVSRRQMVHQGFMCSSPSATQTDRQLCRGGQLMGQAHCQMQNKNRTEQSYYREKWKNPFTAFWCNANLFPSPNPIQPTQLTAQC